MTGLARLLRAGAAAAFVLGLLGATLPDDAGTVTATAAVVVVVGVPLARVAWLGVRWARKGDARFAALAGTLLLVVATGAAIAATA
jgi:hypothetical protein